MNALLSMYVYVKSMFEVEEGQDLIEYALIIGLVVIAAVGALMTMSGGVQTFFEAVNTQLGSLGAAE